MDKKRGTKKGSKIIGTNLYHFGKLLASARRKKGLTQVELADLLGTTSRVISYYERESKNPSLDVVKKMAQIFGIKVENLLDLPNNSNMKKIEFTDRSLFKRFEIAQKLPPEARNQLKKFIDTLLKAHNLHE